MNPSGRVFARLMIVWVMVFAGCRSTQSHEAYRTIIFEAGGVKVVVPPGWTDKRDDNKLVLSSPDLTVKVVFFAPRERGMEAGMAEVDKTINNRRNTGVDMRGKPIADKMHVQNYYGTGDVDGEQARWMMTLVDKDTFEEPRLAILTVGEAKAFQSKLPQIMEIINGLRRIA